MKRYTMTELINTIEINPLKYSKDFEFSGIADYPDPEEWFKYETASALLLIVMKSGKVLI
jgi:hypothetical protein